jgi:acyl-CoA dehydrogenase
VWAGIAAAAVERARLRVRRAAAQQDARPGPAGHRLARAVASLQAVRAAISETVAAFGSLPPEAICAFGFQAKLNMLKVTASERCLDAALDALRVCGLEGYRNDSECSVGRHIRDLCSGPLMISNDRIVENSALTTMMIDLNRTLFDG